MKKTNTVSIRLAKFEDSKTLADLATQLGYPSTPEGIRPRLEDLLSRIDENAILVAEMDGRVIGWVHAHVYCLLIDDPEVEIGGLIVDESVRSKGIGEALMHAAEEWTREQGYASVYLRSNTIRTRAHEFYKRLGYEIVKSQYALRKHL